MIGQNLRDDCGDLIVRSRSPQNNSSFTEFAVKGQQIEMTNPLPPLECQVAVSGGEDAT